MDRVRMKSNTDFHNPLVTIHGREPLEVITPSSRMEEHTVHEGEEFSTTADHAQELETLGYAVRVQGEAAPESETAARFAGFQTSAGDAIQTNRKAAAAPANKKAAEPDNKAAG